MIAGEAYSGINIDIWSSGVTLYAMLCGYLPFEHAETKILYKMILKGEFEVPDWLSPCAVSILKGLLCVDPN